MQRKISAVDGYCFLADVSIWGRRAERGVGPWGGGASVMNYWNSALIRGCVSVCISSGIEPFETLEASRAG
jgi:hypothetical protein